MGSYPQHDRLRAEKHKTEIIHAFWEFASGKNPSHELCRECHTQSGRYSEWALLSTVERDKLMAEFIEVDMDELEREKRAMLDDAMKIGTQILDGLKPE